MFVGDQICSDPGRDTLKEKLEENLLTVTQHRHRQYFGVACELSACRVLIHSSNRFVSSSTRYLYRNMLSCTHDMGPTWHLPDTHCWIAVQLSTPTTSHCRYLRDYLEGRGRRCNRKFELCTQVPSNTVLSSTDRRLYQIRLLSFSPRTHTRGEGQVYGRGWAW